VTVTERRLRQLFADAGFRIRDLRCNRHWWVQIEREDGAGPAFSVAVPTSPGDDHRFGIDFRRTLKRAERAAKDREMAA
jgi:hypothetical protein